MRTVQIRGQDHTVMQAINRQLSHYANHVGQIIYLAKHFKGNEWQTLSVPKNKSADASAAVRHDRASAVKICQMVVDHLHHVNVTVPRELEAAAKQFYGVVLGLKQIPKPATSRQSGAWYQIGETQLHLSVENEPRDQSSSRHVCFTVSDLAEAEQKFREAGVEVIPDPRPNPGTQRFYVRDPGGNQLEIVQSSV